MNEPPSHSAGQKQAIGCGFLVPPLLGIGIAAWMFRDGIPPAVDGAAPPQLVMAAMAVLASFLIGFVIFVRSRRARRRATSRDHMTESITGDFNRRGRRVAKLVFGTFLIFGLAFTIPFGLMLWRMVESRGWEPARCTVVSSEVGVHSGDDGSTYSVDIAYRYRWLGDEYRGDRYNFSFGSSSGYDGKAEVVSRYPVGSEVECWVDPDRPERSVLTRGVGWEALLILFPLAFVAVGLFGVLGTFGKLTGSGARKDDWLPGTTAEEERRPAMSAAAGPARIMPVPEGAPGDPNALEASSTPKGRLVGSIIGAILWNGIVWTIIYFVIIRGGDADGCVMVFTGLFALIGLLILLSVPYYALALANPLLRARIGGVLTPGRSTSLSWRFDGKTDRIRCLIFKIEGREEARYRKGTSTYTAKNVFYEKVLLEVTDRHAIASGQTTIEIPEGTMHSFDGGNNKVIWSLTVQGDIPRWPDVTDRFDITVRPEGLG